MIHPYEAWADLRRAGKGDGHFEISSKASTVQTGYGPVRFGLGSSGEPRLLVPCAGTQIRFQLKPTSKLKLGVSEYHSPTGRGSFIDLMCTDPSLETVFSELASEVLRRVEEGKSPEVAVTGVIEDFRSLLSENPSSSPSREVILGLLGELYILSELAKLTPGADTLWQGPWVQRHDFRSAGAAIEVKTSGRPNATRVSIHGADQLLPPTKGSLVLIQLCLEEARGADLSIGRLYQAIKENLSTTDRLDKGLELIGCIDPYSLGWNRHEFSLEKFQSWEVKDGFPRVTPQEMSDSTFPTGVEDLEYKINLSAADSFRLSRQELATYMKSMCHG